VRQSAALCLLCLNNPESVVYLFLSENSGFLDFMFYDSLLKTLTHVVLL
jgi:hypothetical protein